jgi:HAD superfamily phosphatase (TIGR01668 family)
MGFQFSVFSFQFSVFSFQFSVFSFQFSVFSFQFSVFSFQFSVFSVSSFQRLFQPDLRVAGVEDLTLPRIGQLGLDALLLDADCTLKRYGSAHCTPKAAAWLAEMRAGGIGLCLVSNGLGRRIRDFAATVELPFVANAWKPLPCGCRRALRKMGFSPGRTAMVGDQVFADVMAGRLAGLTTILVAPIHPEEEPWFTQLKRPLERWVLGQTEKGLGIGN